MSAIRISKDCSLYLVQAAQAFSEGTFYWYYEGKSNSLGKMDTKKAVEICEMLDLENAKSLNARYKDAIETHDFKVKDFYDNVYCHFKPIQVLKTIQYYCYQTCEHEGFYESEAYQFLQRLKERAIYLLPGYEACTWGEPEKETGIFRIA